MKKRNLFFCVIVLITITTIITIKKCNKNEKEEIETNELVFGVDVSQYNGDINWDKVKNQKKHKEIKFVIIRSTMGTRVDKKFHKNFNEAKKQGFKVGAYHYYDPNENSKKQAENFIKNANLQKGDILPVLDIEKISKVQNLDNLRKGLKNYLRIIEDYYGVKPIIYTGLSFYEDYLKNYGFSEYPLWVAAYSAEKRMHESVKKSVMHQFSDKVKIPGIKEYFDGNDASLNKILI